MAEWSPLNDYFHEQYGMRSLPQGSEAGWYHDLLSSLIIQGRFFCGLTDPLII